MVRFLDADFFCLGGDNICDEVGYTHFQIKKPAWFFRGNISTGPERRNTSGLSRGAAFSPFVVDSGLLQILLAIF